MKNLVEAAILTLALMVLQVVTREKINYIKYLIIFFLMFFGLLAIDKVYGDNPHAEARIYMILMHKKLTPTERTYYEKKRDQHLIGFDGSASGDAREDQLH